MMDQRRNIVAPGWRESSAASKCGCGAKNRGAGLGLAISRRFCESLGGGISVDSAPGEGVTMTVRLPEMADAQEAGEVGVPRQLRPTG